MQMLTQAIIMELSITGYIATQTKFGKRRLAFPRPTWGFLTASLEKDIVKSEKYFFIRFVIVVNVFTVLLQSAMSI